MRICVAAAFVPPLPPAVARAVDRAEGHRATGPSAPPARFGNDPNLRADLHGRGISYVLAVARDHRVCTPAGYHQAIDLAASLPPQYWQRLSAGPGAKGHLYHDWAWIEITVDEAPGRHWLLIRRNVRTGEPAFYRAPPARSH